MEETTEKRKIVISEVIELMRNGYTKSPSDSGYNENIGSIQEHYGLTDMEGFTAKQQLTELFKHPSLKGIRTRRVRVMPFEIVDDTTTTTEPVDAAEVTIEEPQTVEQ